MKKLVISDVHLGAPYFKKEIALYNLLCKRWDEIIIAGDFFELKGFKSLEQIKKRYTNIIKELMKHKVIWIRGNHDPDISAIEAYAIDINGCRGIITHGHQFDKPQGSFWIKLNIIFYYIFRFEPRRFFRKFKSFVHTENKLREFYKDKCNFLIAGHTHEPKQAKDYYNSGDWIEHCSWIEIDGAGITLKKEGGTC